MMDELDEQDKDYQTAEEETPYEGLPEDMQIKVTSTTNPARPRTHRAGYNVHTGTMTVIFRGNVWWNYYDVPLEVWKAFQAADSKGIFLRENGFDAGYYAMGPTDMSQVSRHQRVMLTRGVETSARLQKALEGKQRKHLRDKPTKRGPYFS